MNVSLDTKKNMYVDSVISGAETEKSAVNYCHKGRTIMNNAKFNLRAWASNCSALQDLATHKVQPIQVIKSILWCTSSDILALATKTTVP